MSTTSPRSTDMKLEIVVANGSECYAAYRVAEQSGAELPS